jgi:hypothetical protein
MAFETKVRSLMRELIEPMLEKGLKDRELIISQEKDMEKQSDRIDLLETSVFQKDTKTGRNKFNEYDEKLIKIQTIL